MGSPRFGQIAPTTFGRLAMHAALAVAIGGGCKIALPTRQLGVVSRQPSVQTHSLDQSYCRRRGRSFPSGNRPILTTYNIH